MRVRFVFDHLARFGIAGVFATGGAVAIGAGALAACSSSDSSTHGFVIADSGGSNVTMNGDDDSGLGKVVEPDASGDDTLNSDGGRGDDDTGDDDGDASMPADGGGGGGTDGSTGTDSGSDGGTGSAHVCDGVIGAAEYGNEAAGQHSYTSATQTWYMDWDATNLYIAVNNANVNEPVVFYLGENAMASAGLSFGYSTYDGTAPSSLGFPANFVVFAKGDAPGSPKYSEYRVPAGTAWSSTKQTSPVINVCVPATDSGAATTRELVIPWAIAGSSGLPAAMKFAGYVETGNSASPYIYGQIPSNNPGGSGVATSAADHYFTVVNTADGGTPPFGDPL